MLRRIALILTGGLLLAAGCTESAQTGLGGNGGRALVTRVGMAEYLLAEKLADLEAVEAWDGKYDFGLKLTTAHYEIYTTMFKPVMLREIPSYIESAYRGYNKQLPEPIETSTRFKVYLFADRSEWEDFTREFVGDLAELFCKIQTGAYYHNGACVAYDIGREKTFSAIGHEGWHQFNGRHFQYRLPSWINEGIATQFESARSVPSGYEFEPDWNILRMRGLADTIKNRKMIRLKVLVSINPAQVLASNRRAAMTAFYSQSYALVRFLREAGHGARLDDFRRLLLDGLRGDWPLDEASRAIARDRNLPQTALWNQTVGVGLFERYIDSDFEKLEREYVAYCRAKLNL